MENILSQIIFNADGLVPVIAQQHDSKDVLMMAWMNREALEETLKTGQMCYFSRTRGKLWRKGESSGQRQVLKQLIIDCDGDTLLAMVEQTGVACHTGRPNCFFNSIRDGKVVITQQVLTPPDELYEKK